MNFKYKCLLIISPLIFILDQLTKQMVEKKIALLDSIKVIPGFFDIVHYTNTGAAFGFLSGAHSSWRVPFFYAVSIAALIAIFYYVKKMGDNEKIMPVALALVVGGILGNGVDRIRLGHVTDFLSLYVGNYVWPAFNVADSAITVAMILLVISSLKKPKTA